jgi:hypothetical protein
VLLGPTERRQFVIAEAARRGAWVASRDGRSAGLSRPSNGSAELRRWSVHVAGALGSCPCGRTGVVGRDRARRLMMWADGAGVRRGSRASGLRVPSPRWRGRRPRTRRRPARAASTTAVSSTVDPRPMFTSTASWRIPVVSVRSIRPRVSGRAAKQRSPRQCPGWHPPSLSTSDSCSTLTPATPESGSAMSSSPGWPTPRRAPHRQAHHRARRSRQHMASTDARRR